jgi:hypothetical protein
VTFELQSGFTMKAQIIIAWAVAALAGFGGRAMAGESRYLAASSQVRGTSRTVVHTVGVPLFFYTSPQYSSSMYGSPDDGSDAIVPKYHGSSAYASRYYRYQYNPWYTDKVHVRYEIVSASSTSADVQMALARRGYYRGAIDGVIGPMSRTAIWRYQDAHGLRATGSIDHSLLRALGVR